MRDYEEEERQRKKRYEEEDRKHKEWRRRQDRRFYIGLSLSIILVVGLLIGLGVWMADASEERSVEVCQALGAEPLSIGEGHSLCLSPDGRVVGSTR